MAEKLGVSTTDYGQLAVAMKKETDFKNAQLASEKQRLLETQECTFAPVVNKKNAWKKAMKSSDKSIMLDPSNISEEGARKTVEEANIFNRLFKKSVQAKTRQNITTEQLEFERSKTECTFAPVVNKTSMKKAEPKPVVVEEMKEPELKPTPKKTTAF